MNDKAETLRDEYRTRFARTEQYRNNVWKILCDEYFRMFVSPEAHVLDLGSGWGEFINNIEAAKKYAMDLNPDAGRRLSGDAHFLHQDCSHEWRIQQESLDIVFTSNFLEHLPDKGHVERTIAEAYRCLKYDGLIICLGPNIKYVPGAYWDFWDHFIPITELSLSEVLRLKGFSIELSIPRFLPYSMSTGRTPPLFLVKLYLKLSTLWPLFGKQFLLVGRKKKIVDRDGDTHR
ncbi:MAG: class I SAM-dependent methyltransferase [Deltaproteobacteria bacterium]|nr:class I SAM-dependent methyltransferase [Deltaproteobacteria bacterium]